jgi:hypothetical protein
MQIKQRSGRRADKSGAPPKAAEQSKAKNRVFRLTILRRERFTFQCGYQ